MDSSRPGDARRRMSRPPTRQPPCPPSRHANGSAAAASARSLRGDPIGPAVITMINDSMLRHTHGPPLIQFHVPTVAVHSLGPAFCFHRFSFTGSFRGTFHGVFRCVLPEETSEVVQLHEVFVFFFYIFPRLDRP